MDSNRRLVESEEITETLWLRADDLGAYPVFDGIPVLLAPEMLTSAECSGSIDTGSDPYREAYEEMEFYGEVEAAARSDVTRTDAYGVVTDAKNAGPFAELGWLDSTYEIAAQADAYEFLAPIDGVTALQLGGKGIHAVKFLLAGAANAYLVTPVLGEAIFARELAAAFGVGDRFDAVVGIAEEIPFVDSCFDRAYAGGCVHHMVTERAFPEIRRVLKPGAKFAAIEPWRAPLYGIGTKILGKREREVKCRPLESDRIAPLFSTFDDAAVNHHGTFTRYALIALAKAKFQPRRETVERLMKLDDRVASKFSLRQYGSSVAILARRGTQSPPVF